MWGLGGQLPAASSRTGWLKMTGSQASDGDYPSKCVRKHPQGPNVGGGVGNEVPRSDMVAVHSPRVPAGQARRPNRARFSAGTRLGSAGVRSCNWGSAGVTSSIVRKR